MRIVNAAVWLSVWVAVAIAFHGYNDPALLLGEGFIPAGLWLVIDRAICSNRGRSEARAK